MPSPYQTPQLPSAAVRSHAAAAGEAGPAPARLAPPRGQSCRAGTRLCWLGRRDALPRGTAPLARGRAAASRIPALAGGAGGASPAMQHRGAAGSAPPPLSPDTAADPRRGARREPPPSPLSRGAARRHGTAPGAAWRSGQGVGAPRPGEAAAPPQQGRREPGRRRKRGRGEPGGACPPAAHCGRVRGPRSGRSGPGPPNAARVRGGRRSAGEPRSYLPPRRPPGAGAPAAISYLPLRLPIGPPHHPSSAPPRPGRASPLAAAVTAPTLLAGSNGQLPIRAHGGGGGRKRPPVPRAACWEL